MKVAAEQLKEAHYDISGGAAQLRGAVRELTARVSDINAEGSCLLIAMYHTSTNYRCS